MASLKKKMFVKLNKKQASPTDAQLAFFKPIYADRDFFDLPIIYNKGIAAFKDYHNPIVEYQQRAFSFSESGLKEDLQKKGANTDDLIMSVRNYELGKVCVQVKCDPQQSSYMRSYEIGDIEKRLKDNIKNLWCTECIISMPGVDMYIYRFYDPYCPVGRFYLFPSWQLCSSPVEMDEITFFHLDLSDLLLDMIDEMHERKDMLKEYCKELKLQQLSSISFDIMDIQFWDEQRVARAARDYYHRERNEYNSSMWGDSYVDIKIYEKYLTITYENGECERLSRIYWGLIEDEFQEKIGKDFARGKKLYYSEIKTDGFFSWVDLYYVESNYNMGIIQFGYSGKKHSTSDIMMAKGRKEMPRHHNEKSSEIDTFMLKMLGIEYKKVN